MKSIRFSLFLSFLVLHSLFFLPLVLLAKNSPNFQLIPGKRSLPDRIPQDEFIYVPEGQTNDPYPRSRFNSEPPTGTVIIPPANQEIGEISPEYFDFALPPQGSELVNDSSQEIQKPGNVYVVEKADPRFPFFDAPDSEVETSSPTGVLLQGPHTTSFPAVSPDHRLDTTEDPLSSDALIQKPDTDLQRKEQPSIEQQFKSGEIIPIASLGSGSYIQIVSYTEYPPVQKLLLNNLVVSATAKGKLILYKAPSSKYYRLLVGPFTLSEVGVEMFRWRRAGFDDAFLVHGK